MKKDHENEPNHAPGAGSDKQHPETPADANARFQIQKKEEEQKTNTDKK